MTPSLPAPLAAAWTWIRSRVGRDVSLLLWVFVLLAAFWAFAEIAGEVAEGDFRSFDEWALRSLRHPDDLSRARGPAWLHEAARDVTALGSVAILTLASLAVIVFLLLQRKPHAALLVVGVWGGGLLLNHGLKLAFGRDRPSVVPHLAEVGSPSFPSAHAMVSTAVYLSLAVLVSRLVRGGVLRGYVLALGLGVPFLVGSTRVYLGVHYPSDVFAGWLAGLIWAIVCGLAVRWLQRRGAVEPPGPEPSATGGGP